MSAAPGVIAKTGAEGAYLAAIPAMGLGLALKVEDGATRAAEAALLALLDHLGALDEAARAALAPFRERELRNFAGLAVGRVTVAAGWPRS